MANLAINGGKPVRTEPFPLWPPVTDEEAEALIRVLKSRKWSTPYGDEVVRFEQEFARFQGADYAIAVSSGEGALRVALQSVGIGPGDEVIIPAYTFIATATAVLSVNAIPIFVDIDPATYNISLKAFEEGITERTKGVIPVHFGGVPADMERILSIARKKDIKVIEDACQAWGSEYKGKKVGAIGDIGCFSFQSSKNITAGEGGIVVTNSRSLAERARALRNNGRFPDGRWYEHHLLGGNFRLTEFQGALLSIQLKNYPKEQKRREENAHYLKSLLDEIEGVEPLKMGIEVTACSYHLFIFKYKREYFNNRKKERFLEALNAEGIPASGGYLIPLYRQPLFLKGNFHPRGCPFTCPHYKGKVDYSSLFLPEAEKACAEEAVWLHQRLLLGTKRDIEDIATAIEKIRRYRDEL